ncbi:unnamed protein product, partial [Rotaria sp. Silwood1]
MAAKSIPGATSVSRRRLALVIGIDDYENHPILKNPKNDAEKLSSLLQRIGFIIDTSSLVKTYAEIKRKILDFELSIELNDVVLFYFAGHGVQWEDQNYLMPKDFPQFPETNEADLEEIAGILEKGVLKKEMADMLKADILKKKIAGILKMKAINAQDILNTLSDRKPYVTIFLLDCCREYVLRNPDLNTRGPSSNTRNSKSAGLAAMHKAGALVAFACAPGTYVDDRPKDKNSLFMEHLIKPIETPNEDIVNILRDVIDGVMEDSNDTQIPFLSVQLRHKNIYLCEQAQVQPKVEAPISENNQSCMFGQDTQILWKFSGIGKPRVAWFFNDQPLPTNDRLQVTETDDGTSILTIRQAKLADEGVYKAKAINAFGEAEAQTALKIDCIKPVINTNLDTVLQVTKCEILTLKVIASGTPKPHVVWMRDDNELIPNDRIQVTTPTGSDDQYTLTILNVQPEDQGEYSVMISNVGGSLQSDKCKAIVSKSPMFIIKPTTQKVKQGETAVFMTTIDGYPTPTITWLLNGKLLTLKEDVEVQFDAATGQSKLSIQNVNLEQHTGSITCRVESEYGEQEETVRLDILVAPTIIEDLPIQQEIVSGRDIALKVVGKGSPRPSAQ